MMKKNYIKGKNEFTRSCTKTILLNNGEVHQVYVPRGPYYHRKNAGLYVVGIIEYFINIKSLLFTKP
ncbi:hypothetical protein SAMN05428981_107113 [Bacillus sp. OV194]|nr:hypothetical protein SAMN05428981_107113 [Bacillus sp. OV194]